MGSGAQGTTEAAHPSSVASLQGELEKAGVVLGESYPNRIVEDLKAERAKSEESVLATRRDSQRQNDPKGYDIITLPTGDQSVVFTR